jgi:hypothetical protein
MRWEVHTGSPPPPHLRRLGELVVNPRTVGRAHPSPPHPLQPTVNISVRLSDGTTVPLTDIDTGFTVEDLKRAIEPKVSPPCPPELQRLVFKGRVLKDSDSVAGLGRHRPPPPTPHTHASRVD